MGTGSGTCPKEQCSDLRLLHADVKYAREAHVYEDGTMGYNSMEHMEFT